MPSRRQFLRWSGVSAAASISLAAGNSFGQLLKKRPKPVVTDAGPVNTALNKPAAKKTFLLGMATYTLRDFPLDKMLTMVKRVGLTRICLKDMFLPLTATPEKIAETVATIKKAGIEIYGCGPISMHSEKEVDRAFEYTKAVGAKVLVSVPSVALLPLISEKAKQYDIRIAIHNHGPEDKVFPTPKAAYEQIKNLDPRMGLCIDVGHTLRAGDDPSEAIEQYADRLFDVHLKDESLAAAKGKTIEGGRGVLDLVKVVRALNKIDYKYVAGFEFEKDSKDPLPGVAETIGYIHGIQAAI